MALDRRAMRPSQCAAAAADSGGSAADALPRLDRSTGVPMPRTLLHFAAFTGMATFFAATLASGRFGIVTALVVEE